MANLTKTIEANGSKGHHKFTLIVEETYVGSGYQNTSDVSFTFKLSAIQNGWDWNGWASKITYKVTINGNEYTGSIGSYNGSSTVTLKSGSETIEHNGDGTKSIGISFQVTDTSGQSYTCGNASNSDTFALTSIPRYATSNQSLSNATETSFTVSWWSDSTINYVWYSIDNGSNWVGVGNPNYTSGNYTISNLQENTTYNVKTKVRRADSNLETISLVGTWTTYSYPKPISSTNFTIGNGATVNLYNPLSRSVTLYILKVGETNNSNHLGYYSGTGNGYINSEFKTSNAISRQYASIPNNQNGKYYCRVVYGSITKDFTDNNNNTYSIAYNDNEKPVFNASKISYTNSGSHSGFGDTNKFIKGHNNITVTIQPMTSNTSANGDYYTISSSGISSQTKSHTGSNITVSNFGNLTTDSITVTAVDKRQQSRSATVNVPWIDYFNPYISNANINRENAIGEKAVISISGKYTNWSGLSVSNSIQTVKYKIVGIHNSFQNMPSNAVLTNQNGDWTLTATLQDTLNISNSYEIQFQFTDKLETITATGYRIGTADALLWRDLANKRLGVRKKPDYTLDVNGSFHCDNDAIISGTIRGSGDAILNGNINRVVKHGGTGGTSGVWCKLVNIKFNSHYQGEFTHLKILLGAGNNGEGNQNAYIDFYMQLGWTGSYSGRFGCYALLNPCQTSFSFSSNTSLKVIANSNIDYDVWMWTSLTYVVPNTIVYYSNNATITEYNNTQTTAPSGTECNITYDTINRSTIVNSLPDMSNVAYKNQNNNFTTNQTINGELIYTTPRVYDTNANDLIRTSSKYISTGSNIPESNWCFVNTYHDGSNDGYQLGYGIISDTLYTRNRNSGNWSSWTQIAKNSQLPIYGSNSNGSYIRFPNIGIQICWRFGSSYKVTANSYKDVWFDFPAAFNTNDILVDSFLYSDSTATDPGNMMAATASRYSTGFTMRVFSKASGERWPYFCYIAIGTY